MKINPENRKIWPNAMRESFFEKMTSEVLFKATSTQNQDSRNEFRESAHVDRLTELVLQEQVSCGCVYHRGNQAGTLVLSRRWSIFEHCGWCIIYVKLNSEAVYKKQK